MSSDAWLTLASLVALALVLGYIAFELNGNDY